MDVNNSQVESIDLSSTTATTIITTTITIIFYPRPVTILAAVCAILFIIIGVIGNLATVIALLRNERLKSHATTWFILSLCMSDLLFCLFNLPISASRYIHQKWILGQTLCRLFPFLFYGNVATSLMSLVAITINRYVLISHYSWYNKIYQKKWIGIMVGFLWTFSFSMLLPPLFEIWGKFGLNETTFSCTILKKDEASPKKFLFIFGILFPCLVILICYTRIFFKVRQSRNRILKHRNESPCTLEYSSGGENVGLNERTRQNDLRLTRMMLMIFCCFLICFLPLLIFNVVDDGVTAPTLHVLASILAWASSVINPFIYAVSNSQYRHAYMELFTGKKQTISSGGSNGGGGGGGGIIGGRSFITEMVQVNNYGSPQIKTNLYIT